VKRPIPVYFIAGWSFLVLTVQNRSLAQLAELRFSDGQDVEHLWKPLRGLLLILVVWHVVRLIQLKPFNRWLSVVSFVWATISAIWFVFLMGQELENPFRMMALSATSGLLSLTSALYLVHRRFREFAVQFVLEREKEKNSRMMQKASQKAMLNDLKR
jgi:hypothetical protein